MPGLPALVERLEALRDAIGRGRNLIRINCIEFLAFSGTLRSQKISALPANRARGVRCPGDFCRGRPAPKAAALRARDGRNRFDASCPEVSHDRHLASRSAIAPMPGPARMLLMPETNQPSYRSLPTRATTRKPLPTTSASVESQYAPERSQPFQSSWFFHYTVRITNEGDETVQLLVCRHWIATTRAAACREVQRLRRARRAAGAGSGESFQYTSGWPLKTSQGELRGTYQMVSEGGAHFDARSHPSRSTNFTYCPLELQDRAISVVRG